ncbi:TIGR03862 family flavoprotein [Ferrovibrio sp.]|uniref:TIGR03862 family flavoprotein n=1 Tax=Ferrovibrio sp. TaxID=1917215 RepID=UPI0025C69B9E|nr:TIGR03862 family flavoprotein [Ferrovibrio sp.]MBX3456341.1 TIGR03862 family flavoprotein [Ferrovibrio sp.]
MPEMNNQTVAIIGGGPAGLMAAEVVAAAGIRVRLFERMPSVGRKFLMAGRGGLNITHSEPLDAFRARYGEAACWLAPYLEAFPPSALVAWCAALGQPTFIGSSGRIFPEAMKASPLLRAWLNRLAGMGVEIVTRAEWTGFDDAGMLLFKDGSRQKADAVLLALGGASWPRLGADGGWQALLPDIAVSPLRPANCGFYIAWSDILRHRHAGAPLKRIALRFGDAVRRGEAVITAQGIEGGAVYALSAALREAISRDGQAILQVDLRPDLEPTALAEIVAEPRRGASLANFLRKRVGLSPVAIGLVQEALHNSAAAESLERLVKSLPLVLTAPFDIERAISTAGGIARDALDEHLMLRRRPGVFAAGEMLDWEAPTGGYLLQACFATGFAAGHGITAWLARK